MQLSFYISVLVKLHSDPTFYRCKMLIVNRAPKEMNGTILMTQHISSVCTNALAVTYEISCRFKPYFIYEQA